MFCPACKSEFIEGITKCPVCDIKLIDELPPEPEMERKPLRGCASLAPLVGQNDDFIDPDRKLRS